MTPESDELQQCPSCPDGYVWNIQGPTGKTCPVCKGYAMVNRNGSALRKEQINALEDGNG